jgi:hypothetical protein
MRTGVTASSVYACLQRPAAPGEQAEAAEVVAALIFNSGLRLR